MPFVLVDYALFGDFNTEFGDVFERVDAAADRDCVELMSRERWLAAGRERFVFVTGIGSPWEPGGALCTFDVPSEGTLFRCDNLHSEDGHGIM